MRLGFSGSVVNALTLAAVVLGLSALPASAQSVEFRGKATVIPKSKACAEYGWDVGKKTTANMRYRPPKLGSNGDLTKIALFYPFWSTSFTLEKGRLGSKFKTVSSFGMSASPYFYTENAAVRVTSLSPSKITATTKTVKIEGEVRGFDEMPKCVVTFNAKLKPH